MSLVERIYGKFLWHAGAHRGIRWDLPGSGSLRIDPRCRWIRNPEYEAPLVEYLTGRIRPGQCCIDVGAHVGFYALQMALWTSPGGRVIAFEPNPEARAILQTNTKLNRLTSRIRVEASAVGSGPGIADLFDGDNTTGLSRLGAPNPWSSPAAPATRVDVVALDDYCRANSVVADWLLIDAEGAELDVLRGAVGLLTRSPVGVVVEMHQALWGLNGTTPEGFADFVGSIGRRIVAISGQGDPLLEYGNVALV